MSVAPDQILEPSTLPARRTLIGTSALLVALSALIVAAFLTLPSIFNLTRIIPYLLVVLVLWLVPLFARMAIVGSAKSGYEQLLPAAIKRKLWVHAVWKMAWFGCSTLTIFGGVIAWAAGFPPQPFILALVILMMANLVETGLLNAILEIGILRRHWPQQHS